MIRIDALKQMVAERRFGFEMDEVMTGTHQFENGKGPEGTFPMEFRVTWGAKNLGPWINPVGGEFMVNQLKGKVDVGGLVIDADCDGTLELRYMQDQLIRYTFQFADDSGTLYRYIGEKRDLRPWNLHKTHTTCYGKITNLGTGELVSTGTVYFRYSQILPFVLSFRLA